MALPSSGQISFDQIRVEYGNNPGQISLSQYYIGGGRVPDNANITKNTKGLFIPKQTVPTIFPQISFEDFLGTGDVGNTIREYTLNDTYTFIVPSNVNKIEAVAIGAGGGGAGALITISRFNSRTIEAGGGGGAYDITIVPVTPGSRLIIKVGKGGLPGWTNNSNRTSIAGENGTESSVLPAILPSVPGGDGGRVNFPSTSPWVSLPGRGGQLTGTTSGNDAVGGTGGAAGSLSFGRNTGRGGDGSGSQNSTTQGNDGYVRIRY